MSIYLNKILPEKSIVANSNDKDSLIAREWLIYLNNNEVIPEYPIPIDLNELKAKLGDKLDINKNKVNPDKLYFKNKNMLHADGYDKDNNAIYEFYGCFWHGCRKCHPQCEGKHDRTMERQNILEAAGYKVQAIWECEWNNIKKGLRT